jgi:hypothetical protein
MAIFDRLRTYLTRGSSVALISAVITMAGLLIAVITSRQDIAFENYKRKAMDRFLVMKQQEQIEQTNKEVQELRTTNEAIKKSLEQVRSSGRRISMSALDLKDRQKIDGIVQSQSNLDARMSVLENSLMASPEKAVAVPILKQQLDSLQDRTHSDLDGIRSEIGRLFTLTQWFIGLMFTIALGMFGLSFNLRKVAPAKSESSGS